MPSDGFVQFTSTLGLGAVAVNSLFLGSMASMHATLFLVSLAYDWHAALTAWCLYATGLSVFHVLEFITTAAYQPRRVTAESFLLNHSPQYKIAAAASWVEFWLEYWLAPSMKGFYFLTLTGAILMVAGQSVRSVAMCTASTNFNHRVQHHKSDDHQLVTWGVYSVLRHPSYTGWFWWSVGSQILLGNPLCTAAYAVVSWRFFEERISFEEEKLTEFFPDEYPAYRRRTMTLIPGIP